MSLELLTAPTAAVATLKEAKKALQLDHDDDSELIEQLVAAATKTCEAHCRRRFLSQQWRYRTDHWPARAIRLPYPPLASVENVKYVDTDGVLQTLSPSLYTVRPHEVPGEIVRAYNATWPDVRNEPDAVRVEFTCGWATPDAVPPAIKRAVLLVVGTLYANRETLAPVQLHEVPQNATWLLGPWRVIRFDNDLVRAP